MSWSEADRAVLAGLADVLIPAGGGLPSASEAGVAGEGLDQVLSLRPDLWPELERVLHAARGKDPARVVAELRARDPGRFGALADVVPGAYFLNPRVLAAIGYSGQGPRPIEERPVDLADDLLRAVLDRGPIYRPTPQ